MAAHKMALYSCKLNHQMTGDGVTTLRLRTQALHTICCKAMFDLAPLLTSPVHFALKGFTVSLREVH